MAVGHVDVVIMLHRARRVVFAAALLQRLGELPQPHQLALERVVHARIVGQRLFVEHLLQLGVAQVGGDMDFISVVLASSMEKARALETGSSGSSAGGAYLPKPAPLGKYSIRKPAIR
ncbi:hypothetical protein PWG14_13945 (plasmid) [Chromobacterium amazonense]|nr:hypothetical protein [Chromobacterium amazonense]MDE1713666.1 hypothetical protein [Chromobacterium amazonense]